MQENREIMASEANLRLIIGMSPDAVMVLSRAGIILFANPAAERLFERPATDMVGTEFGFPVLGEEITEIEVFSQSGVLQTAEMRLVDIEWEGEKAILLTLRDITEHKKLENQQRLAHEILATLNRSEHTEETIRDILKKFKEATSLDAVAIRLRQGDDFPYYATDGFSEAFLREEHFLSARTTAGEIKRDESGNPLLEGMCGNILRGRTDPEQPFFTKWGSFWTNNSTQFLATTTETDRLTRTRDRCNSEGYESMALIPLRNGEEILGLLQLNDHRPDRFTLGMIDFFERLGDSIGVALAKEKMQEQLTEEKDKAQMYLDVAGVMIVALDTVGRITLINKKGLAILGELEHEIIGQNWFDWYVPAAVSEKVRGVFRKLIADEIDQVEYFENPIITKDGEERILAFHNAYLKNAAGETSGIIFSGEDITERKQAEDELQRSEKEFRLLAESMPQIVWVTRKDGWNTYFNQQWVAYTGLTLEESYGHGWNIPFHPDDQQRARIAWENATKNNCTYSLECRLRRADGVYRWWLVRGVPLLDETGEIIKWFGTCTDIDDIKSHGEAIRASEEKFRIIFDSTLDGILLADAESKKFHFANATICRMLGYDQEEIKNLGFMDIHPEKDIPFVLEHFEKHVRREIEVSPNLPVKRKDGSLFFADITSAPIEISGRPYLVFVLHDITDRKKLEAQLRQAQKMEAIGTLAGGIAHDFNNILNVIMGYGGMVMETLAADSPVREEMSEVLVAADRAVVLTKRLLLFSRKEVAEVAPIDIDALILDLRKMLARIIRENIEFHLDLADKPLIVMADSGQIEQVLMNLVSNAKDVMLEGGKLIITTSIEEMDAASVAASGYGRPGRYALIAVADTGQGIDAEIQQKIFEPFFTTKGVGKGTGLGLAISYGIIKQHNGYIKVNSEPGRGTVFKIYLPLCDEAILDKKPEAPVPVMGGSETVLLAEDDAALMKLTRVVLESFGYTVITAEDGEEAIAKFLENRDRINLVFLDIIMPKKNGKEVFEAIRKVSPKMKILFASGYTMKIISNKELEESGCDFIQKPYPSKILLSKVREVLDK